MKTYSDVYKFPLYVNQIGFVYDSECNFIFQYECSEFNTKKTNIWEKLTEVINGTLQLQNTSLVFKHEDGYIRDMSGRDLILIRGWGNLTGAGGMNLSEEEATNIQDTLADYIVQRLNCPHS